jgi:hypothetical protein
MLLKPILAQQHRKPLLLKRALLPMAGGVLRMAGPQLSVALQLGFNPDFAVDFVMRWSNVIEMGACADFLTST